MTHLTLDDIAAYLRVDRRRVRDEIVKRKDFPKPIWLSRMLRYWPADEFEKWFEAQRVRDAGRPRG